jgi:AhpD family alkylhydroperoxidase
MSATVEVFDPSMCCSTGVCGPSVDPLLPRFAADLDWLKDHGIQVTRHNLSQEPAAFAAAPTVQAALTERGTDCLPLILVDGRIVSQGTYPTRAELATWTGLDGEPAPTLYSDSVAELVAIGAAIAANCEPCFKYHYDQARKLGVSKEDMARAVATAQGVKDAPARFMLDLADRYLGVTTPRSDRAEAAKSPCCGPSAATDASTASAPAPVKSSCC